MLITRAIPRINAVLAVTVLLALWTAVSACGADAETTTVPVGYVNEVTGPAESSGNTAGGANLTAQSRPLIDEVNSPPDTGGRSRAHGPDGPAFAEIDGFDAARGVLGISPLVPRYLPEGIRVKRTTTTNGQVNLEIGGAGVAGPSLSIVQGRTVIPSGVPVRSGYSEDVEVNGGADAKLIRGMWTNVDGGETYWDTRFAVQLIFTTANHGVVTMTGVPASDWPRERLVRIANSLEPSP